MEVKHISRNLFDARPPAVEHQNMRPLEITTVPPMSMKVGGLYAYP